MSKTHQNTQVLYGRYVRAFFVDVFFNNFFFLPSLWFYIIIWFFFHPLALLYTSIWSDKSNVSCYDYWDFFYSVVFVPAIFFCTAFNFIWFIVWFSIFTVLSWAYHTSSRYFSNDIFFRWTLQLCKEQKTWRIIVCVQNHLIFHCDDGRITLKSTQFCIRTLKNFFEKHRHLIGRVAVQASLSTIVSFKFQAKNIKERDRELCTTRRWQRPTKYKKK